MPPGATDAHAKPRRGRWSSDGLLAAVVIALTALAYLRSLGNGFVWDDDVEIVHNAYLGQWSFFWRSFSGDEFWFLDPHTLPHSQYYRPLFDIWYALNYHLFGLNPAGWHAAMVALHLLVVFLVFKIALALTTERWATFLAALLFGLMPIHVEAVGWVSATNVPSTAFVLGAFWFYIRRQQHPARYWPASLVLYAGGLLTYEGAAAFPALIAAYAFLLEEGGQTGVARLAEDRSQRMRRTLTCVAPYAAILLADLVARLCVLGSRFFASSHYPENHLTTAGALLNVPAALATYLLLLAEPWRVGPAQRLEFASTTSSTHFYLPFIALLGIGSASWLLLRRHSRRRLYLFCGLWILLALAPMLNLGWMAPRLAIQDMRLYLPSVAWCIAIGDLAYGYARRGGFQLATVAVCATLVAAGYAISLFRTQGFWHDEITLYTQCTREVPEEPSWHKGLGTDLEARGDVTGAAHELETAARLDPSDGVSVYDLGVLQERLGHPRKGAEEIAVALSKMPHPPASGYVELARAYDAAGDSAASEAALEHASSLPGGAELAELGQAQLMLIHGQAAGAEKLVRAALARDPNNAGVLAVLGSALEAQNQEPQALVSYQQALMLRPNDPRLHYLVAHVLHRLGRNQEALNQVHQALRGNPNDTNAEALQAEIEGSPH